tara:strand:- start:210 stop:479 length:270 start_codon:yes stop_codon:yes gene_type:complete
LLFLLIILFLSFKNQTKIIENDLKYLKQNYKNDYQNYINKEILLTKQINLLKNNELNIFEYDGIKKIIKFDRNEFDDFTIIKVNYVQSK